MNPKKSARFLNPVLCSPWESRASKLHLSAKNIDDPKAKKFIKTSSNSRTIKKVEFIPKEARKDMAQEHTIINITDSPSTSPSHKSATLRNEPIPLLNTQNENVNQSSNVNIQNLMRLQNVKVLNSSTLLPAKDRQLIKLYTPGNFQSSSAPDPQTNSSAENILNVHNSISNFNNYVLISSPVGQYNFSETPANFPIISPINYDVNQQWNSYGTFTIGPNTVSTFSSAPNTVVNSSTNIQSNKFGNSGKENEQIVNSINISTLQPFPYYSKTSTTSVPLGQDDIRNATSSIDGFQQDQDMSYKVQSIKELETCASHQHLLQFPNTSVPALKLNETRAQKECANPIRKIEIVKKIPNQEQTVIAPSNKQKILLWESNHASESTTEPQRLVQEEQSNSRSALGIFEELRLVTKTQCNRKREFNSTDPANYNYFKNFREHEIATDSKLIQTTPIVNDSELNDEFINCLYGEFDINDKGDIEFSSRNIETPSVSNETCQNILGLNGASQSFHESQVNRERKENKNKVGVVLKKKKMGYQSSLL